MTDKTHPAIQVFRDEYFTSEDVADWSADITAIEAMLVQLPIDNDHGRLIEYVLLQAELNEDKWDTLCGTFNHDVSTRHWTSPRGGGGARIQGSSRSGYSLFFYVGSSEGSSGYEGAIVPRRVIWW